MDPVSNPDHGMKLMRMPPNMRPPGASIKDNPDHDTSMLGSAWHIAPEPTTLSTVHLGHLGGGTDGGM